jgi:membrane associated rhomboid family serine protease
MREAAVGFQCVDCVSQGARETRQGLAMFGGARSSDPRLTTFVLIGINAVIWLAISATGRASSRLVDLLSLMPVGRCDASEPGMYYPGITAEGLCARADGIWVAGVADGAVWKVFTYAFTHVEIWHIAFNMMALFFFGPPLEQLLGRARFLAVYLLSAFGGGVVALWLADPTSHTVGASGAIFGLLGALAVLALKGLVNRSFVMQNLALGVVVTVIGWQFISWQGHLGGLLVGAAATAAIAYAPKQRRSVVQWSAMAALLVALVALVAVRALALA